VKKHGHDRHQPMEFRVQPHAGAKPGEWQGKYVPKKPAPKPAAKPKSPSKAAKALAKANVPVDPSEYVRG
jgi:hypothetical protein